MSKAGCNRPRLDARAASTFCAKHLFLLLNACALLHAQVKKMVNMRLAVLVLSVLLVSVTSRQLQDIEADSALEHQRILAELEEVHQLRERMLQQGMTLSEIDCFASVLKSSCKHVCSNMFIQLRSYCSHLCTACPL